MTNATSAAKPTLAYISPLPPARSGIAVYSAELLPHLAAFYQITVIVAEDEVDDPWINAHCQVRDAHWFMTHGGEFARVIYHIGNSPYHTYQFDLIQRWPGVVMLHDSFLGHLLEWLNNRRHQLFNLSLYRGWGYHGLLALRDSNFTEVIREYPLNYEILANASAVIVHSPHSIDIAHQAYGDRLHQPWRVIPHLRTAKAIEGAQAEKKAARAALQLPENAFVVCSFGHVTATKRHDALLAAWLQSPLAADENCHLVFVGEKFSGDFEDGLDRTIAQSSQGARIHITGWADRTSYQQYLAAADLAVQLRQHSRGETSGAVLDCMGAGLATIVNAHGSQAYLPDDAVHKLPDDFSTTELSHALEQFWRNREARQNLGDRARQTIAQQHNPDQCAHQYREAIEGSTATAFVKGSGIAPPRQLFIDVSAIAHNDLQTGIERVVRAQLLALIANPPAGFRVEPVLLAQVEGRWRYLYAQAYTAKLLAIAPLPLVPEVAPFRVGDILYIPDLNPAATALAAEDGLFSAIKAKGVRIHVLVHDILPITAPLDFPPGADYNHERWLRAVCTFADQLLCTTQTVADAVNVWLRARAGEFPAPPQIAVNHHGCDIAASGTSTGLPEAAPDMLARIAAKPTFLMVGTIEPRKRYLQALSAFEQLWQQGQDVQLVIVGKEGWQDLPDEERRDIPETLLRLTQSEHYGKRLFWLPAISDEYLTAIYRAASCLLAASSDEGFGLPLIEAARHNLPVLARDIPVFREVAGAAARYFSGVEANDLATAIRNWQRARVAGTLPEPVAPFRTWAENAACLKTLLLDESALPPWVRGCPTLHNLYQHDGLVFVQMAYLSFLGREPSAAEQQAMLAQLHAGISKSMIAAAMRYSPEALALPQHLHLRKSWLLWKASSLPVVGRLVDTLTALAGSAGLKKNTLAMQQHLDQLHRENQHLRTTQQVLKERLNRELPRLQRSQAELGQHSKALAATVAEDMASLRQRQQEVESHTRAGGALATAEIPVDDGFYVAFEEHFRGAEALIKTRLAAYLPIIKDRLPLNVQAAPMADIGCGRGEWLELLGEAGFNASGVDLNGLNVAHCQGKGLAAAKQDGIAWLRGQESNSLALVSAFHVIEHLNLGQLTGLLTEIIRVLKPGGLVILETPNPENLITAARRFYTDPTHRNPVPAEFSEFLLGFMGFAQVRIHRLNPDPEEARLPGNSAVEVRLNELLHGAQDYAVVACKPV